MRSGEPYPMRPLTRYRARGLGACRQCSHLIEGRLCGSPLLAPGEHPPRRPALWASTYDLGGDGCGPLRRHFALKKSLKPRSDAIPGQIAELVRLLSWLWRRRGLPPRFKRSRADANIG